MRMVFLTHACGREPYCGGKFRENVGKALWGRKWDRVLDGGPDADKVEVGPLVMVWLFYLTFGLVGAARSEDNARSSATQILPD